jgi:hypothetical protein
MRLPVSQSVPTLALALLLGVGCSSGSESAGARAPSESPTASAVPARQPVGASSLVNRLWVRSDSTGLPYRLARWQLESDTTLRWREDAADIRATIRSLRDKELILLVSLRDGSDEQHYTEATVPYVCPDMRW